QMGMTDPGFVGDMLRELLPMFENDELRPLPRHVFPLRRAREAFRFMAGARHVGKIVVTMEPSVSLFRPDASYLISGGLGALGLETARWMVEQGARNLVLLGRRRPSEAARGVLAELERQGARLHVFSADV